MVGGNPSPRNDAVHMYMVVDLLVPGMEHLDNARCCPEIFLIGRQLQEYLGTASVEEPIEKLLVTVEQGIEFMWKREYHMEIGRIDHFRPALVHPDLFFDSLTVWTVTVAAGVIVEFHMPAVWTLGNIYPKFSGFTVQDSPGSIALGI